ncbi:hypothetical protein KBC79_01595 [Candidatus Woesebacteria bacterium]|nr:hypothetical protein [Candidatus Woesebacteria bacterium]
MNNGTTAFPYSSEGLKALAETLQLHHQSMLWMDPVTNSLQLKQVPENRPALAPNSEL